VDDFLNPLLAVLVGFLVVVLVDEVFWYFFEGFFLS